MNKSKQQRFSQKQGLRRCSSKVFLAPTEGLWGLSASALSSNGAKLICLAKKRPEHKSFIILYTLKCQDLVWPWVDWSQVSLEKKDYYLKAREKFITFLLPASKEAPETYVVDGKISLRLVNYGSIQHIVNSLGFPILSTSANISGQPPLTAIKDLKREFDQIPFFPGRLGGKSKPSLIVDLVTGARLR